MMVWKTIFLFNWVVFRFHVNLPRCCGFYQHVRFWLLSRAGNFSSWFGTCRNGARNTGAAMGQQTALLQGPGYGGSPGPGMINIQGREVDLPTACYAFEEKLQLYAGFQEAVYKHEMKQRNYTCCQCISCISWIRPREELAMAKLELHQRQTRHVLLKDELQHLQQALLQRKSPWVCHSWAAKSTCHQFFCSVVVEWEETNRFVDVHFNFTATKGLWTMWPISTMLSAEAFPRVDLLVMGFLEPKPTVQKLLHCTHTNWQTLTKKTCANSPTKSLYLILVANSNILCDYI